MVLNICIESFVFETYQTNNNVSDLEEGFQGISINDEKEQKPNMQEVLIVTLNLAKRWCYPA